MSLEIQKKNELKEKAMQFINDFEEKRRNAIELRKKENVKNESKYFYPCFLVKKDDCLWALFMKAFTESAIENAFKFHPYCTSIF